MIHISMSGVLGLFTTGLFTTVSGTKSGPPTLATLAALAGRGDFR